MEYEPQKNNFIDSNPNVSSLSFHDSKLEEGRGEWGEPRERVEKKK